MDINQELIVWNTVSLHVVDVTHGLLIKRQTTELFESSVFLFVHGKNGSVQIDDMPFIFKSNCLFHIGGNKRIMIDPLDGELEFLPLFIKQNFHQAPDAKCWRRLWKAALLKPVSIGEWQNLLFLWNNSHPWRMYGDNPPH